MGTEAFTILSDSKKTMYAFNAYTLILPGINVQFECVHGEGRSR